MRGALAGQVLASSQLKMTVTVSEKPRKQQLGVSLHGIAEIVQTCCARVNHKAPTFCCRSQYEAAMPPFASIACRKPYLPLRQQQSLHSNRAELQSTGTQQQRQIVQNQT